MDFRLTEDQELLRREVAQFVDREIVPKARELDEAKEFPAEVFGKLGELGYFGARYPEEYGGTDLGLLGFVLLIEEIARGSLALGATLATVALMTGQWLLLPLVGIVFVGETLSVIIQKAYRLLYNDERLFKMAPIHHHFELSGWSETKVTLRFWILGLLGGLLAIALALV